MALLNTVYKYDISLDQTYCVDIHQATCKLSYEKFRVGMGYHKSDQGFFLRAWYPNISNDPKITPRSFMNTMPHFCDALNVICPSSYFKKCRILGSTPIIGSPKLAPSFARFNSRLKSVRVK